MPPIREPFFISSPYSEQRSRKKLVSRKDGETNVPAPPQDYDQKVQANRDFSYRAGNDLN